MERRAVLAGLLALGGCTATGSGSNQPQVSAPGKRKFPNGYYDDEQETFYWTNIGGDPLKITPAQALAQPRIASKMPQHVMDPLLADMAIVRRGPSNYYVKPDDRFDIMVSGKDGWIASNVVAIVPQWRANASREAWVVYNTDPATKRQWRLTFFEECKNIAVDRFVEPFLCDCDTRLGDACPKRNSRRF